MIRGLMIACSSALVCACASQGDVLHLSKKDPYQAITPTEQFSIKVTQGPDEILLAPHAYGVSDAQEHALEGLVDRWRNAGSGVITIRSPEGSHEASYHATAAIQNALEDLGVHPEEIQLVSYDAPDGAPIGVGFVGYRASGPDCGQDWRDFTKTGDNRVNSNFGCAVTANIAAQIANPSDLLGPRPMDSSNATRRATVMSHYEQGAITSTPADPQAHAAISGAIQ